MILLTISEKNNINKTNNVHAEEKQQHKQGCSQHFLSALLQFRPFG